MFIDHIWILCALALQNKCIKRKQTMIFIENHVLHDIVHNQSWIKKTQTRPDVHKGQLFVVYFMVGMFGIRRGKHMIVNPLLHMLYFSC